MFLYSGDKTRIARLRLKQTCQHMPACSPPLGWQCRCHGSRCSVRWRNLENGGDSQFTIMWKLENWTCTNLLAANKLFFLVAHVVVPFESTAADIPAVLLPPWVIWLTWIPECEFPGSAVCPLKGALFVPVVTSNPEECLEIVVYPAYASSPRRLSLSYKILSTRILFISFWYLGMCVVFSG